MKYFIEKIYSYNNEIDLGNRFYDDLIKRLRNEPDKIEFLKELQSGVEEKCENHEKECDKSDCGYVKMNIAAVKIIKSVIQENMQEQDKQTKQSFVFNAPINGHVANQEVNGDYIINNFTPVQQACEEAKLTIEQIAEVKALFEKKDKNGLIDKIISFGIHASAIIAGHSIMHFAGLGQSNT